MHDGRVERQVELNRTQIGVPSTEWSYHELTKNGSLVFCQCGDPLEMFTAVARRCLFPGVLAYRNQERPPT